MQIVQSRHADAAARWRVLQSEVQTPTSKISQTQEIRGTAPQGARYGLMSPIGAMPSPLEPGARCLQEFARDMIAKTLASAMRQTFQFDFKPCSGRGRITLQGLNGRFHRSSLQTGDEGL